MHNKFIEYQRWTRVRIEEVSDIQQAMTNLKVDMPKNKEPLFVSGLFPKIQCYHRPDEFASVMDTMMDGLEEGQQSEAIILIGLAPLGWFEELPDDFPGY